MTLRAARRLYIANAIAVPVGVALSHGMILQPILIVLGVVMYLIMFRLTVRAVYDATVDVSELVMHHHVSVSRSEIK